MVEELTSAGDKKLVQLETKSVVALHNFSKEKTSEYAKIAEAAGFKVVNLPTKLCKATEKTIVVSSDGSYNSQKDPLVSVTNIFWLEQAAKAREENRDLPEPDNFSFTLLGQRVFLFDKNDDRVWIRQTSLSVEHHGGVIANSLLEGTRVIVNTQTVQGDFN